ncbi:MAG: zinc ribbon domain-containing protein, partial [Oscillospiraceae bacterium]|nr:zinc ribbon domain-containing protein [Oscillospiraceae bacterium]
MAKFCTNCGATLDDDKKFCTECGAPVNEAPAGAAPPPPPPQSAPQPQAAPVYAQAATATMPPPQSAYQQATAYGGDVPPPKGSKYEPITTGGFIGIMLLMCIPIVGQILMIIWAFAARKVNKRSLARASLIMMVVMLIISFLIGLAVKS